MLKCSHRTYTAYSKGKLKIQFHKANVAERSLVCRLHLPLFISLFHTFFIFYLFVRTLFCLPIFGFGWFRLLAFVYFYVGSWTVNSSISTTKKSVKIWVNAIILSPLFVLFSYFIIYFIRLLPFRCVLRVQCLVCSVYALRFLCHIIYNAQCR